MAYRTYGATEVAPEKTQGGIKRLLLAHGGSNIAFISATDPRRMEGLRASVTIGDRAYGIKIAATVAEKPSEKAQEQEVRRVWRVLYYHLKAIFEAVDSGVIDIRELLLPYFVTRGGRSIAEHLIQDGMQAALEAPRSLLE